MLLTSFSSHADACSWYNQVGLNTVKLDPIVDLGGWLGRSQIFEILSAVISDAHILVRSCPVRELSFMVPIIPVRVKYETLAGRHLLPMFPSQSSP